MYKGCECILSNLKKEKKRYRIASKSFLHMLYFFVDIKYNVELKSRDGRQNLRSDLVCKDWKC